MKKFYVGIKAIIKEKRGYLIIKHVEGHWDIPGGRMDGDETFGQTLTREVSEELPGAKVVGVKELQGAYRLQKDIAPETSLVLLYFLVDAQIPHDISFGDEHESHLWINQIADIPDGLNSEITKILQKLLT